MSRASYYGVYAGGKTATGSGPLKFIRGLAAAISHPGMGTGRRVCIMQSGKKKPVECYERGRRVRKGR